MKTRCSSSHILAPLSPSSWTAIKIYRKNIKNVTAADDDFAFVLEKNGFLAVSSIVIATSSFAFCALPEGKKHDNDYFVFQKISNIKRRLRKGIFNLILFDVMIFINVLARNHFSSNSFFACLTFFLLNVVFCSESRDSERRHEDPILSVFLLHLTAV